MSYFDSPKNVAHWNKELRELKKRKELRKQGLDKPVSEKQKEEEKRKESGPTSMRQRTSYQELLQEEAEAVRSSKAAKRERMAEKTSEKSQIKTAEKSVMKTAAKAAAKSM